MPSFGRFVLAGWIVDGQGEPVFSDADEYFELRAKRDRYILTDAGLKEARSL